MKTISRREFLKLTGATAAGATLLSAGCSAPATPPATPSVMLGATPAGTATWAIAPRLEVIRLYPDIPSKGDPGPPRRRLERRESISGSPEPDAGFRHHRCLTGLSDAGSAWSALFRPSERIAIKVNAFHNSLIWTHVPLVTAVTDRLKAAGVPDEQIFIFDSLSTELQTAGFTLNPDGPGVRCLGTDQAYSQSVQVAFATVKLSDILANCDALINMPMLKSHMISGVTFAMKNYFGSVNRPDLLHSVATAIPALNALAPIRDRTRLIIGDVLTANLQYADSYPYWEADYTGDSILMSFDPVAHDAVGLQLLSGLLEEQGESTSAMEYQANPWLRNAANGNLGTNDAAQIVHTELHLG